MKQGRLEHAVLIGVKLPEQSLDSLHSSLEELKELCYTSGAEVTDMVIQVRQSPDPRTFIGKGKLEEISLFYDPEEREILVFNHELSPSQARNVEEEMDCKVLTRSQVIMDIFALHARTRVSRLQVELAQLKYNMSRLTRKWTHLSRTLGGIGVRGPGETQLESDRRAISQRIHQLQEKLKTVEKQKATQSRLRGKEFKVTLVGYTNSGKSTLLNQLVKADILAQDQLFATLETTTRKLWLGDNILVLVSDTVGFIRDLPPGLLETFHSTLEDVSHADLLIHIADISTPDMQEKIRAVEDTIREIGAGDIPRYLCFNKCDRLEDKQLVEIRLQYPEALYISALANTNLDALKDVMRREYRVHRPLITYTEGEELSPE